MSLPEVLMLGGPPVGYLGLHGPVEARIPLRHLGHEGSLVALLQGFARHREPRSEDMLGAQRVLILEGSQPGEEVILIPPGDPLLTYADGVVHQGHLIAPPHEGGRMVTPATLGETQIAPEDLESLQALRP
jgi:hypothetical protein